MKNLFLLCILFCSCLHRAERISYEKGVVIGKHYDAPYTSHRISMDQYYNGKSYTCCVPTSHYDYHPEVFVTTFKCSHGDIFKIYRQDIYAKLNEFDTVEISYYDMVDKKGQVKDYDFIDANKSKTW